jgi:uncharacterized protein (TIGR02270 family)
LRAIQPILKQQVREFSALWVRRRAFARNPKIGLDGLTAHDERMQQLLDALMLDADFALSVARSELSKAQNYGELFGCLVLAMRCGKKQISNEMLRAYAGQPEHHRDLVGALMWSGWASLETAKFSLSNLSAMEQLLALSAFAALRIESPELLNASLHHEATAVRCRALRAVGELGRHDLIDGLRSAMQRDPDVNCRIWAAWSFFLLTPDQDAMNLLVLAVHGTWPYSPLQWRCLELLMTRLSVDEAQPILQPMVNDPRYRLALVKAAGWLGTPSLLQWLTQQLADKALAQTASASVHLITGSYLPDCDVDVLGRMEDREVRDSLGHTAEGWHPVVNSQAASDWVQNRWSDHFTSKLPRLAGVDRSPVNLLRLLLAGCQPIRASAALCLTMNWPQMPLLPVFAPAKAQLNLMRSHPALATLMRHVELVAQGIPDEVFKPRFKESCRG